MLSIKQKLDKSFQKVYTSKDMVERTERPRDEGVYSARIQEDKKEKGKFSELPSGNEKKILSATFFNYLKRLFDTFSPSKNLAGKVIAQQTLVDQLEELKALLQNLESENLSNSPEFAIALSDIWCLIIDGFDQFEVMERGNLKKLSSFRKLIDTIKNYPEDSEHRLGFYLLQHAGKDWLPFPFIEILSTLHQNHQEDAKNSTLRIWTSEIDEVIDHLKKGIPFRT